MGLLGVCEGGGHIQAALFLCTAVHAGYVNCGMSQGRIAGSFPVQQDVLDSLNETMQCWKQSTFLVR